MERKRRKSGRPSSLQDSKLRTSDFQSINKKDQSSQRSQLLVLAMDWNCIDGAKELILQNSLDNILVRMICILKT